MKIRRSGRQQRTVLQSVYEENQKLLGRDIVVPRKTAKQSILVLVSVLAVGLFFSGSEGGQIEEPANSVEELLSPEQYVRASLNAIPDSNIVAKAPSLSRVYGLSIRTIALDPGHGGHDPGAVGPVGLTEKTLTLDLALRLERRLKAQGFNVILTRRKDISVSLQRRIELAKENQADLFVSIHVNALPVDSIAFIETYYFSPRGDARVEALAERENFNSGYSAGEWQSSLQELGQAIKIEDSRKLATSIQNSMVSKVREINPDIDDWGTRSGPFMVLMNASVPAILAEVTAISMPEEEQRLMDIEYREHLASGLESGILSYLSEEEHIQTNVD